MSDTSTDELHDALDAFIGTVFWSDESISLEEALTEAIDDWVATVSAEFNESRPFCEAAAIDPLGGCLTQLAAAVEFLSADGRSPATASAALALATSDWLLRAR